MASSPTETSISFFNLAVGRPGDPLLTGPPAFTSLVAIAPYNRQLPPLSKSNPTDTWWQPTKRSQDGLSAIFGRSSADGAKRLRCGGFNHAMT